MARRKHENLRERSPEFRKGEHIEVLKSFLIACEGECTEPNYINGLVKYQKQQHCTKHYCSSISGSKNW